MANGLGGTRDMGLQPYAQRFCQAGFAVLLFDYRHFGASGGQPRQLIWIPTQLADYAAAVEFARQQPSVDPDRIALWGTSLSGGHVLVRAAEDRGIACAIAQCPGVDGRAGAEESFQKMGLAHGLKLIVHGQRDLVRSWLRLSAHTVPIVGQTGDVALISGDDHFEAFGMLAPDGFVNEACARIAIRGDKYRPITRAGDIRCPVLFQICEYDELAPVDAAGHAAEKVGRLAQVVRYPIGHFDIYSGDAFEQSVSDQVTFLTERLA
jgi:pimeloyl-ACP methyl ester carboxylesterase